MPYMITIEMVNAHLADCGLCESHISELIMIQGNDNVIEKIREIHWEVKLTITRQMITTHARECVLCDTSARLLGMLSDKEAAATISEIHTIARKRRESRMS